MTRRKYTWKIAGPAGFGIKSAGLLFSKLIARAGYETFDSSDYPSLIRGGHNTYQVTLNDEPVYSTERQVDVLVALNQNSVDYHWDELTDGAAVIYDKETVKPKPAAKKNIRLYHVPTQQIIRDMKILPVMRNTITLGSTAALMKISFGQVEKALKDVFGNKKSLIESNIQAARAGYEHIQKHYREEDFKIDINRLKARPKDELRMVLSGNEAIALGALAAGCNFFAAYPMTPSSSILHYLASVAVDQKMIVKHAEDEISVINMTLGAAHTGARAMCATSGGGFSLMTESLGLAGITETGVVIVNAQRPGPATGLPTWTGQGDLQFMLHAAQDEFPRIILAPGDTTEAFWLTVEAFNLADRYQTPIIILSDKFLSESNRTTPVYDLSKVTIDRGKILTQAELNRLKDFRRYKVVTDGVSPRTLPGMKGGEFLANSDEHDEYGFSEESSANRIAQFDKRSRKLDMAARDIARVTLYGSRKLKKVIVGWGSTKGPILDALHAMKDGDSYSFLHYNVIWPFPTEQTKAILGKAKNAIILENNASGQLAQLIRQQTGYDFKHTFFKYDGRPFFPEEIVERIRQL